MKETALALTGPGEACPLCLLSLRVLSPSLRVVGWLVASVAKTAVLAAKNDRQHRAREDGPGTEADTRTNRHERKRAEGTASGVGAGGRRLVGSGPTVTLPLGGRGLFVHVVQCRPAASRRRSEAQGTRVQWGLCCLLHRARSSLSSPSPPGCARGWPSVPFSLHWRPGDGRRGAPTAQERARQRGGPWEGS
jgi:hypothetical protein